MALSRISGLGRDLMMAYAFGDHPSVAAFIVAFRFANVLRRFFGEGPLQSAFIPHFEGIRSENKEEAYLFFRKLSILIGALVILVILVGEGILQGIGGEIPLLTGWMLPSLFFISLYGLNVSFLQCHNRFFVSSMAPFLCNMVWIIGAFVLRNQAPSLAMVGLAKWVLLGFVIQWGATTWQVRKELSGQSQKFFGKLTHLFRLCCGLDLESFIKLPSISALCKSKKSGRNFYKELLGLTTSFGKWFARSFFHPKVKSLAKAFSLGALGVGAVQINSFLDAIFARCAHISGPVYLWYANRFVQLALALFGIAAVNTLVPILSRALKKGETKRGKAILSFGRRRIKFLMIPMTFAIFALGYGAIDLVFGRGSFSLYATEQTSGCLAAYAIGLLPSTLVILYAAVYFAEGNFKTPTLVSTSVVGLNIGLNTLFVFGLGLGAISTALSTSIGAWVNFFALQRGLKRRGYFEESTLKETSYLTLGSFGAGLIAALIIPPLRETFSNKLLLFAIPGTLFVGVCVLLFRKRFFDDGAADATPIVVENH